MLCNNYVFYSTNYRMKPSHSSKGISVPSQGVRDGRSRLSATSSQDGSDGRSKVSARPSAPPRPIAARYEGSSGRTSSILKASPMPRASPRTPSRAWCAHCAREKPPRARAAAFMRRFLSSSVRSTAGRDDGEGEELRSLDGWSFWFCQTSVIP